MGFQVPRGLAVDGPLLRQLGALEGVIDSNRGTFWR
jgi:hypothetical protein